MAAIAILTPAADYRDDWPAQLARLTALLEGAGHSVSPLVWHAGEALTGFDLVLPLFAWGYPDDPARWYGALDEWAAAGARLANGAATLRWNSDKAYLAQLAGAGVAVVPGITVPALDASALAAARAALELAEDAALVVKPLVSGGAMDTFWLAADMAVPPPVAGRAMLVQPALEVVRDAGELSLLYFGGVFSHAIVKRPRGGDFRVQDKFGGTEHPVAPPADARRLAERALAAARALTGDAMPLYARVDMVAHGAGHALMELELIEPALFLPHDPAGGAGLVAAINRRLADGAGQGRLQPAATGAAPR